MIDCIESIFIVLYFVLVLFFIYLILKTENTYRQRMKIIKAIFDYSQDNGFYCYIEMSDKKETFNQTLWRLWDWGCKNIVDQDTYEKIKDYL